MRKLSKTLVEKIINNTWYDTRKYSYLHENLIIKRIRKSDLDTTAVYDENRWELFNMCGTPIDRSSLDTLGIKFAYLIYKEIKGYKAPLPILRPHRLIISSTSDNRIKNRIIYKQISEIIDIYNHSENNIKRILNALYGRKNIYDC